MLDLKLIRDNPEYVKEQVARRALEAPIDAIVALDARRREILQEVEALRRERNVKSKEIGRHMGQMRRLEKQLKQMRPDDDGFAALQTQVNAMRFNADAAKAAAGEIGDRIDVLDEERRAVEADLREAELWVPNICHPSVPDGPDETANVYREPEGAPKPVFDFTPQPHWELGPALDIIDFERGVKLSGSRFYLLKGLGARLQRALIQFMLDIHIEQHGFTEIYPPFMVRAQCFENAAQLPKFFDNIYRDAEDDFMFLATSEVALTNVLADEILDEDALPIKFVAGTPCFRREKMSAGKDVRGIKRGHQFDKVEMYQFVHPDRSWEAHEAMLQYAKDVCDALGFHYRVVELATGDVGFGMAKTYDIEVWAAGCEEWLEVSSISNAEAFQARRANVKFRPQGGGKLEHVHTLNASGLALPRVMIAILENYQQADGTVRLPEVLWPYMGGRAQIG